MKSTSAPFKPNEKPQAAQADQNPASANNGPPLSTSGNVIGNVEDQEEIISLDEEKVDQVNVVGDVAPPELRFRGSNTNTGNVSCLFDGD